MKRRVFVLIILGLWACLLIPAALAQDPPRNYSLAQGSTISIANVSGEINVTGANVPNVIVTTVREGRDKEMVEIEDLSSGGNLSLKTRYPRDGRNYDASVRFIVQVPAGSHFKYDSLSTASGDVLLSNVAGEINARTASGDISMTGVNGILRASTASGDINVQAASGAVTASTASGNIDVELTSIEASQELQELKFASASGDVTVRVIGPLNAQVEMGTASGSISNDFGLRVDDSEGHGRKASGIVGTGAVKLRLSAASGDLKLIK